jgi:glyoxylase I family protein
MGLVVVVDNTKAPIRGYFLTDDRGTMLEIIERPPDAEDVDTRYVVHVAFWVDDYEAAKARLTRAGVSFETETEIREESFRTGFFRDPAGNRTQIVWRAKPLL